MPRKHSLDQRESVRVGLGTDGTSAQDSNANFALPESHEMMSDQKLAVWYNDTVIYPDKVRLKKYYYEHYSFVKNIQMIFATVLGFKVQFQVKKYKTHRNMKYLKAILQLTLSSLLMLGNIQKHFLSFRSLIRNLRVIFVLVTEDRQNKVWST